MNTNNFVKKDNKMKSDRYIKNEATVEKVKDSWVKLFGFMPYMGFEKEKIHSSFDDQFGKENWLPAHSFAGETVSTEKGYKIYDEAYYQFLKKKTDIRKWLQKTASEVMDFSETNIKSGLDLCCQEGPATHLQDIATRRAVTRLELEDRGLSYDINNLPKINIFHGDHIVQIRDKKSEGFILNPGQVPFHKPELGIGETKKSWWGRDTVEDIFQRNKVLLVSPDALNLYLSLVSNKEFYVAMNKHSWFKYDPKSPLELNHLKGKAVRREAGYKNFEGYCEIVKAPKIKYSKLEPICNKYASNFNKPDSKKIAYLGLLKHLNKKKGRKIVTKKKIWPQYKYDLENMTLVKYEMSRIHEVNLRKGISKDINMGILSAYIISEIKKDLKSKYTVEDKGTLYGMDRNHKNRLSINDESIIEFNVMNSKKFNTYHIDLLISKKSEEIHDNILKSASAIKSKYEKL